MICQPSSTFDTSHHLLDRLKTAACSMTDGRCITAPSQDGKADPVFFIRYDEATGGYSVSPGATKFE